MGKVIAAVFLVTGFLVGGCTSIQLGDPMLDAQYKKFVASPDKATLYIYRTESYSCAIKMPILLDNMFLGETGCTTYLYKQIIPGSHKLVAIAEDHAELSLNLEAGKIYYVWQEVKLGLLKPRSKLHLVDEKSGQSRIDYCTLAYSVE
jgi:hypothetical protein